MVAHKVTLGIDGSKMDQSPPTVFERGTIRSGRERFVLAVPDVAAIREESMLRRHWCGTVSRDCWFWRADERP
ncbi:hypothetical protein [Phenylobacterium montanum]|uniref:Uncharacterized protein n=1 Tax=Phenylobacterium montanum TaxID=2823693 RepID=A0A975IWH8_9CAUL|nr:hypothetical protein [Caulobacter sp. S6]QUD89850.1 hypothetical protein KCG34_08265 [Caulobacter sp. S6]